MTASSDRNVGRVAVLYGGHSAERSISLKSGNAVCDALLREGFDATRFDPAAEPVEGLRDYDVAFIALHGRGGEDGTIQGVLEHLGVRYTGSGVLGSALAMDKWRSKQIWLGEGLPTPAARRLPDRETAERAAREMAFPLIVKPAREGSSIGMTRVDRADELSAAWEAAAAYDQAVIAERWVEGSEYTVALLGDRVFPSIRLETPRTFYDFDAKYQSGDTRYHCPSGLSAAEEEQLGELAREAFEAVGASGWGRVDLMRGIDGAWWLLEVNTIPGMTDHSLVPKSAAVANVGFDELVRRILLEACR